MINNNKTSIRWTLTAALLAAAVMTAGCASQSGANTSADDSAQESTVKAAGEDQAQEGGANAPADDSAQEAGEASQEGEAKAPAEDSAQEAGEAAQEGSTEDKVYLDYIDAWEEWHTMEVDQTVPPNIYDPKKFVADERNPQWLTYDDPAYTVLQGIDIYEGTGEIDWKAVADAGYSFAFIRVGYRGYGQAGKLCEDYRAVENLRAAREAGFKIGAYFFSQALNEEEARQEALTAIKVIEESGVELDLPLMYDPEVIKDDDGRANDITREQVALNTEAFRETVESATDFTVDIYSNLPWEDKLFDAKTLTNFDIWYADYEKIPQSPYHFSWLQYSNKGEVPGIQGDVDLDLWIIPN
ncbi:MAG: lysozyme [Lachnospiraceae bacterium]|nr:lysozyme [Lachnospiraceae bacterium]